MSKNQTVFFTFPTFSFLYLYSYCKIYLFFWRNYPNQTVFFIFPTFSFLFFPFLSMSVGDLWFLIKSGSINTLLDYSIKPIYKIRPIPSFFPDSWSDFQQSFCLQSTFETRDVNDQSNIDPLWKISVLKLVICNWAKFLKKPKG